MAKTEAEAEIMRESGGRNSGAKDARMGGSAQATGKR